MKKILVGIFLLFLTISFANAKEHLDITYKKGIYHIIIPISESKDIEFISSEKLITNKEAHKKYRSKLTINAGFFDPNNEKTISYIYNDGIMAENPLMNENIINNKELMNNWGKIANRGEFRIIKQDNKYICDITEHSTKYDGELLTSGQGGPILLPNMDLEKEFFIVKEGNNIIRESASVLHKTARTIIGLNNTDIHILIITDKQPMTIYQAQNFCKKIGLEKALALDGGSSTSLNYKNKIHVVSTGIKGDDTGRKLKSFLIYK